MFIYNSYIPLPCSHSGADGHTSDSCPRNGYLISAPALTCPQCTHLIESDVDNPYNITNKIIICEQHSTSAPSPSSATSLDPASSAPTPSSSSSTAAAPTAPRNPSAPNSLEAGRRMRGVNPSFYKTAYQEICTLVHSGKSLYDALKQQNILKARDYVYRSENRASAIVNVIKR